MAWVPLTQQFRLNGLEHTRIVFLALQVRSTLPSPFTLQRVGWLGIATIYLGANNYQTRRSAPELELSSNLFE